MAQTVVTSAAIRHLYQPETVKEIKQRILSLRASSPRQWGKMNAAQAMAHCVLGMENAVGVTNPPRIFVGRILGPLVKPMALKASVPMRRNSPTAKSLVVNDERDLAAEQKSLCAIIDRFAAAGAAGCTKHPHVFFGRMTPEEWAVLAYKHLDHHLRQFGA
jgi:hypothetical protein